METNELCTRARSIEEVTGEILEAKRVGGEAILTIGRGLIEAKALLEHGAWLPWLTGRVEFSERQAQRFMRLAEEYASNPTPVSDLGARKALALLALPEAEREEFIEAAHVVGGEEKTVAEMSARELERAIRERDMAKQQLEAARRTLKSAQQKAEDTLDENRKLTNELAELKARPVEVAVKDATEEQLAKARAEAAEAFQKNLDAANDARERAEKDRDAAEAAREEMSRHMAVVNARLEELTGTRESESPAGDDNLPQFKLLFEQVQETVNRMHGLRLRMKDPEDAEKCGKALLALAEKIRGCAA